MLLISKIQVSELFLELFFLKLTSTKVFIINKSYTITRQVYNLFQERVEYPEIMCALFFNYLNEQSVVEVSYSQGVQVSRYYRVIPSRWGLVSSVLFTVVAMSYKTKRVNQMDIKRRNKRVLNFIQQVFFLLSTEGSLVIIRAYPALFLGGTPSQETGTSPPSCQLLENRLYMSLSKIHAGGRVKCSLKYCNVE